MQPSFPGVRQGQTDVGVRIMNRAAWKNKSWQSELSNEKETWQNTHVPCANDAYAIGGSYPMKMDRLACHTPPPPTLSVERWNPCADNMKGPPHIMCTDMDYGEGGKGNGDRWHS